MQTDDVVGQQVLEAHLLATGKFMRRRHQRGKFAGAVAPGRQSVVLDRRREHAQVGTPLGHGRLDLAAGQVF